jgi:hypothetical protein
MTSCFVISRPKKTTCGRGNKNCPWHAGSADTASSNDEVKTSSVVDDKVDDDKYWNDQVKNGLAQVVNTRAIAKEFIRKTIFKINRKALVILAMHGAKSMNYEVPGVKIWYAFQSERRPHFSWLMDNEFPKFSRFVTQALLSEVELYAEQRATALRMAKDILTKDVIMLDWTRTFLKVMKQHNNILYNEHSRYHRDPRGAPSWYQPAAGAGAMIYKPYDPESEFSKFPGTSDAEHRQGGPQRVNEVVLSRYEVKLGDVTNATPYTPRLRHGDFKDREGADHDYAWISSWQTCGNPLYLDSKDGTVHLTTSSTGTVHGQGNPVPPIDASDYNSSKLPISWYTPCGSSDWGDIQRCVAISIEDLHALVAEILSI